MFKMRIFGLTSLVCLGWIFSEYKCDALRFGSSFLKSNLQTVSCQSQITHRLSGMENIVSLSGGANGVVNVENDKQFHDVLSRAPKGRLVVVDFTASWCGPCKSIAPKYQSLAASSDYINVIFVKVRNVQKSLCSE